MAAKCFDVYLETISDIAWVYFKFSNEGGTPKDIWLGLNDVALEGTFVWANGEYVTYTNWGANEPNNYTGFGPTGEDFVSLFGPNGYVPTTWNDISDEDSVYSEPIHGLIEAIPGAAGLPYHDEIELSKGGHALLPIAVGKAGANKPYIVLGSISGDEPGMTLDGVHVPLNHDAYFAWTLANPGSAPLVNSIGTLNEEGEALPFFVLPPMDVPALAGTVVHHTPVLLDDSGRELRVAGVAQSWSAILSP